MIIAELVRIPKLCQSLLSILIFYSRNWNNYQLSKDFWNQNKIKNMKISLDFYTILDFLIYNITILKPNQTYLLNNYWE